MYELTKNFKDDIKQLAEQVRYLLFQLIHYSGDLNNHVHQNEKEKKIRQFLNDKLNTIIADASDLNDAIIELESSTDIEDFLLHSSPSAGD